MKALITTVPFGERDNRPLEILKSAGAEIMINPLGRKLTEEDLAELIAEKDILIAGTEPITERVLDQANKLKLIARVGIGLDSVDLLAARARNIAVSYTPDAPSPAVAELTLGLMIELLRNSHVSNLRMHNGVWYRYFGKRLTEITIGVIGLGRIGSRVIKHLAGFDCRRILACDTNPQVPTPGHPNCEVHRVEFGRIVHEADIISIHVPLNGTTRNLITKREIERMKPGALLVNTSRGGVINEQDLAEALVTNHLGGAAVDVFETEPYLGPLKDLDNCLLTAHMGSMSVDCRTQMEIEACEEAARFINGSRLLSSVPEFEYRNL
jgi:D-3-phosphoglycerate dehydrogenase